MHIDLNELGLASYNELIRLKLLRNKPKDELTQADIFKANEIIYNKIGDTLLKETLKYNDDGTVSTEVNYSFDNIYAFTHLILIFALCYINSMNLNNYFNLTLFDDEETDKS